MPMTPLARHYAIAVNCELRLGLRGLPSIDHAERLQIIEERNAAWSIDDMARAHRCSGSTLQLIFQWGQKTGAKVRRFKRGTGILEPLEED